MAKQLLFSATECWGSREWNRRSEQVWSIGETLYSKDFEGGLTEGRFLDLLILFHAAFQAPPKDRPPVWQQNRSKANIFPWQGIWLQIPNQWRKFIEIKAAAKAVHTPLLSPCKNFLSSDFMFLSLFSSTFASTHLSPSFRSHLHPFPSSLQAPLPNLGHFAHLFFLLASSPALASTCGGCNFLSDCNLTWKGWCIQYS